MNPKKDKTSSILKLYYNTVNLLLKNPAVFLPFLIFALIQTLSLTLLFLAPRKPFLPLFGPPIRAFWGERFLHYPANFLLLPKLNYLASMGLAVAFGSLLSGMAVAIIFDIYNKKHLNLKSSLILAVKRYISLFLIIFTVLILYRYISKLTGFALMKYFTSGHSRLLFLGPKAWLGPVNFCLNSLVLILIQALFIYAIPALIIGHDKLISSIIKSFGLFKKLFIKTLILVGLPMLIYLPILVLLQNSGFLVDNIFPESILLILFVGVAINSLVIDPVVTVSTTLLFLEKKEI